MYKKPYHIHFIGIGGIGMSGIARLLLHEGYIVSGCDAQIDQKSCVQLAELGAQIYKGSTTVSCTNSVPIDCIVYSTAVPQDHPELANGRNRNVPIMHRAAMLATLMRKKWGIAIGGAHGKTSTTGMIAHVLLHAQLDPSIIIGGFLKTIDANARAGNGNFFVAEADESDRSLLQLPTTVAVVTNIDKEHLETYADMADIVGTFKQFISQLPSYGCAVLCIDNAEIRSLIPQLSQRIITYGFSDDADIRGCDTTISATESCCIVMRGIQELGTITIPMPGSHMLQNALATVAVGLEIGIPFATITQALKTFSGVERRFNYHGTFNGAAVYDDYGHHPNEIIPTVQMARARTNKKVILVFQPHRYTRMQGLWHEFIEMFGKLPVDQLIITDLYSAGEKPIATITTARLVEEINAAFPHASVSYVPYADDHEALQRTLAKAANADDLILLMGAGSIYSVAKTLCKAQKSA